MPLSSTSNFSPSPWAGVWLSVLLSLAVFGLAWNQRSELGPNRGFVELPQLDDALWQDNAGLVAEVARRFAADQQGMTLRDELRISQWMEAAWNADLEEDCEAHLGKATQLANSFPTLISPWRVLWHCWETSADEREEMRWWIIALLRHSESERLSSAAYPELGLRVHNFTDAMSYISLRGGEVIDAWFETLAAGQLLRAGVLFWDDEQQQDTRWYFDLLTTQQVYAEDWADDEECRYKLAECMVRYARLSSYSAPAAVARGLLLQAAERPQAARAELHDQGQYSPQAALLMFDWLVNDSATLNHTDEMIQNARHAAEGNSAEGKLLLSLLLRDIPVAQTEPPPPEPASLPDFGTAVRWLFAFQPEETAVEPTVDEGAALWQEAEAELGAQDFLYLQAKYERILSLMRWRRLAHASSDGRIELSEADWQSREQRWLHAADAGSLEAMFQTASEWMGREREFSPPERNLVLSYLIRAANQQHREAMYVLGDLFARDDDAARRWVESDRNKAEYWLRQAAALGHGAALERLLSLSLGKLPPGTLPPGTPDQTQNLRSLLQRGVDLHLPQILTEAAARPELLPARKHQREQWLHWAAAQDNVAAQLDLGWSYFHGQGAARDWPAAEYWLRRAEQQGSLAAAHELAQLLAAPEQPLRKRRLAAVPLHRAASAGYAPSQYLLGLWFEHGELLRENLPLAGYWFEQAAQQGHTPALLSHALSLELGYSSWNDKLVAGRPDYAAAYPQWQQVAASGNALGYSVMGAYHLLGAGVDVEPQRALSLLYQGERDNAAAQQMIRLLERYPEGFLAAARPLLGWAEQEYQRLSQVPIAESLEQQQGRLAAQEHLIRWAEHYLVSWQLSPELTAQLEIWLGRGADLGLKDYAWWRAERHSFGGQWLNPMACADYQRAWVAGELAAYVPKELCPKALAQWSSMPEQQRSPQGLDISQLPVQKRIAAYRRALALGVPDADYHLASALFSASEYSAKDPLGQEAYRRMQTLAEAGNSDAAFYVGVYRNIMLGREDAETLRYYQQAALGGNPTAENNFGRLLMSSDADWANAELGWQWVYLAHLQGETAATDTLGEAYEYGWRGAPDWTQAVKYYREAGAAGQSLSHLNAARLYVTGGYGLDVDLEQAKDQVRQAWESGFLREPRVELAGIWIELTPDERGAERARPKS